MRVKLLKDNSRGKAGAVVEASDATGQKWIAAGLACETADALTPDKPVLVHMKMTISESDLHAREVDSLPMKRQKSYLKG